jgi:hypothetical protein
VYAHSGPDLFWFGYALFERRRLNKAGYRTIVIDELLHHKNLFRARLTFVDMGSTYNCDRKSTCFEFSAGGFSCQVGSVISTVFRSQEENMKLL